MCLARCRSSAIWSGMEHVERHSKRSSAIRVMIERFAADEWELRPILHTLHYTRSMAGGGSWG